MSASLQRYQETINGLLLDFQWIELSLRMIVGCSYELLRRSAPSLITFNPKQGALERDALGRLLERYSEVSHNVALVAEMKQLVKDRNYCAHQAFVLSLEEQDSKYLDPEIVRLTEIRARSRKCVYALLEEFKAIAAALHESPSQAAKHEAPGDGA